MRVNMNKTKVMISGERQMVWQKAFHSFSLLISSSSVSAITAKSSAYSSSHGRATLTSKSEILNNYSI